MKDISLALELEVAKISKKINNINKEQENNQNYSLLAFLLVFLTVFLVLLFLRKSIFNQKDELVEKLKSIREELDKDYVHLDNKVN
ncbi:MAG: hypothetical protein Q9M91_06805 [Candidatus Dojkabacteria bacterium]|nr:hypothetical protein [Candidatus Dojkabacteria bacterium]